MSTFDEAMRRAQFDQRQAAAASQSRADIRRRGAEQAAVEIQAMLNDFVRFVSAAGVQPIEVLLHTMTYKKKGGRYWRPREFFTPSGYVLRKSMGGFGARDTVRLITVVTPDARLYKFADFIHRRVDAQPGVLLGEYVPVTADSLLAGNVWLTSSVTLDDEGRAFHHPESDFGGRTSVDGPLARLAAQLAEGARGR